MVSRKHHLTLTLLLGVFLLRAVTAAVIVPPWQGADEPAHFNLTYLLTFSDGTARVAASERAVLESMARYWWWQPRGERTPNPLPRQFLDVRQTLADGTYIQPLYYGLGAVILSVTRPGDLETAYWHLRALGVVLAAASIALAWAGTRLLFGSATALGVLLLAALHPQFLLTALTVSPDVLVIFLGAFIWWETARLVRGDRPMFSVALILLAAVAALLTKRTAVPLAGAAVLVALAGLSRLFWRRSGVTVLAAGLAVVVLGAIFIWVEDVDRIASPLVAMWLRAFELQPGAPEALTLSGFQSFITELIDRAWWSAGWGRLPAPDPWMWLARTVTVVGIAGAALAAVHFRSLRRPLLIAALFMACQLAAVFTMTARNGVLPHPRFVYPVFAPALALIWTGLVWVMPSRVQPHASVLLMAIVIALDTSALILVLVPAYLT